MRKYSFMLVGVQVPAPQKPNIGTRASYVDIHAHLSEMKPFVASRDWNGLEHAFYALAAEMAGAEQAARIAQLPFRAYQLRLQPFLAKAHTAAVRHSAKAIYFEYDLDNDWQSAFFICERYNAESAQDDDWACDWTEDFRGPDFAEASAIYRENSFNRTPVAKGSTLYLVARTVASFGRCCEQAGLLATTTCMGFHDQDPIVRIVEAV